MGKHLTHFTPEQKVSIIRKHLVDKVQISAICEEYEIQPTVFYRWMKEFFENGAAAFAPKPGKKALRHEQRKMEAMEAKLRKKDEVLAELMEEHVALKKSLGEP